MRFRTWAAIVVQSVVIGCSSPPDRAGQEQRVKPIIENIIEISHAEPPPTLREVFADPEVRAIARVTVTSRRAADRTLPRLRDWRAEGACQRVRTVGRRSVQAVRRCPAWGDAQAPRYQCGDGPGGLHRTDSRSSVSCARSQSRVSPVAQMVPAPVLVADWLRSLRRLGS